TADSSASLCDKGQEQSVGRRRIASRRPGRKSNWAPKPFALVCGHLGTSGPGDLVVARRRSHAGGGNDGYFGYCRTWRGGAGWLSLGVGGRRAADERRGGRGPSDPARRRTGAGRLARNSVAGHAS